MTLVPLVSVGPTSFSLKPTLLNSHLQEGPGSPKLAINREQLYCFYFVFIFTVSFPSFHQDSHCTWALIWGFIRTFSKLSWNPWILQLGECLVQPVCFLEEVLTCTKPESKSVEPEQEPQLSASQHIFPSCQVSGQAMWIKCFGELKKKKKKTTLGYQCHKHGKCHLFLMTHTHSVHLSK